jgi:phage baseplate assembly protein gpV
MMQRILNQMRGEGQRAAGAKSLSRRAIVSAYDPSHYAAKVMIQPENFETGFLPIGTPWVGNEWGLVCPPTPGDEVDVHFQEGGKNAAYISLRFYGNLAQPPSAPSGEFWLIHKSGSLIKLTNDGKVTINGNLEIDATAPTINITATDVVNVTAPVINLGSNGETLHKLVTDAFEALFNEHVHSGVQGGGGDSGPPTTALGSGQLTSVVSAG